MPEENNGTARYSLYWTWASAAMSCHAALEELDVSFDLRFIDLAKPWPDGYEAMNPHKKIPTLIDHTPAGATESDKDIIVYQSAAILLYLAENHPEAEWVPPLGHASRAACYQWLFFMAESLHATYLAYYYPQRHTTDKNGEAAVQQKAIEKINEFWGRIDTQIGAKPFLLGDHLSVCDFYLLPMIRWNESDSDFITLKNHANVMNTANRLHERESVSRMLSRHLE